MQVTTEISYPGATAAQAYALCTDVAFREEVCRATHASDYDVTVEHRDHGGAQVRIERTMAGVIPDFAQKFVGDSVVIVQTEDWGPADDEGSRTAALRLQIQGQPATMTGTIDLTAEASGALESIRGDLKIAIPFIGGRFEPMVVEQVLTGVRVEQETGRSWLQRGPSDR